MNELSCLDLVHNTLIEAWSEFKIAHSPIFIDLNSQEVVYGKPRCLSTYMITDSGKIWSWDQLSNAIWEVSSTNAKRWDLWRD